jgi:hypothetical protein
MNRIGLIDVDSHSNFPNLALMKISAYHKAKGDAVEWWKGFEKYDRVYQAKIFTDLYTKDNEYFIQADEIIKGGTGYDLKNFLPAEIEHIMPDYSIYPTKNTAYGFLTRGCPRGCHFCIVAEKEGRKSVKVADLSEFWNGQKHIEILDPNILACKDHIELLKQLSKTNVMVNLNQGVDCRLLTEENITELNQLRMKEIHFAWDYMKEENRVIEGLMLYNKQGKTLNSHSKIVYVLVNFDTTMEENLYRIYKLKEMGYAPYVMVYNKYSAPKEIKELQRWVNNRIIFWNCDKFEDYTEKRIYNQTADQIEMNQEVGE